MGRQARAEKSGGRIESEGFSLLANSASVDPALASLFAASSGPVQAPQRKNIEKLPSKAPTALSDGVDLDEDLSSVVSAEDESSPSVDESENLSEAGSDVDSPSHGPDSSSEIERTPAINKLPVKAPEQASERKRKRKAPEEDIEDVYMRQIARKEAREDKKQLEETNKKRRRDGEALRDDENPLNNGAVTGEDDKENASESDAGSDSASSPVPQHETLAPSQLDVDLEKSARTVFLGNVSTTAITSKSAKKTLLNHLSSFLSSLPSSKILQKVESLRFRSTAYATAIPKKAAFTKKELLDATTRSTNAYAVYSTQLGAREAAKRLNGTVVLGRHLRVDEVAHPAKTDHRRCVFVGNLGFVDDESALQAAAEEHGKQKQKKREPADVEEGLWREFGKCGTVESVRVVRDSKTRVGKGFAYVQFTDENSVEAALLFNDKKFPPMLPRKLRVVRAKAVKRNQGKPRGGSLSSRNGIYNPKADPKKQSMQGRVSKLFGKAGAAQTRSEANGGPQQSIKPMESFVFEGYRATAAEGKRGLKAGGKAKRHGKPTTRSSKRGAAWKSAGGKKSA